MANTKKQNANVLGTEVISALSDMAIPPAPPNYEVWYTHLAQLNKQLSSEIENMVAGGKNLDEFSLQEIRSRYLAMSDNREGLEQYLIGTLEEANNLKDLAATFSESTTELNNELDSVTSKIEANAGLDTDTIMSMLMAAANSALARNDELEKSLAQASSKIDELQSSLQTAAADAETDHLTGLSNRRCFDRKIEKAVRETREDGEPLCVVVTDIDHFKKFNDTWGHQVGDQVLILVADVLKKTVKGQDIVARYGGEEFAIALPNTSIDNAERLADSIRIAISKKKLVSKGSGGSLGNVTMSFGVAEVQPGETPKGAFERADKALYAAKGDGRNCVRISKV